MTRAPRWRFNTVPAPGEPGHETWGGDSCEKIVWKHPNATVNSQPRGGLLSTAGGLLFGSDGPVLYAMDARNGTRLWSFDTGGHISAPPITFREGDRQFVAVVAGQDLFTFALPKP